MSLTNVRGYSNALQQRGGQAVRGARRQGIFWILTIPQAHFTPYHPPGCRWIRGQLESGEESGYLHWQLVLAFFEKQSSAYVREMFGSFHCELTKSSAANEYVWKESTRVEGTQFEFGIKPIQRNSKTDWESVWTAAQRGRLSEIPANIRVISYRTLRTIAADYAMPEAMVRTVYVFWGCTRSGKSYRARAEAGVLHYNKDPCSKFWYGYQGQENVVIDEFGGGIHLSHVLRWFDPYAICVEVKNSSAPLCARRIWLTSNINPELWYPGEHPDKVAALLERFTIIHMNERWDANLTQNNITNE